MYQGDVWAMNADGTGKMNLTHDPTLPAPARLVTGRRDDRLHPRLRHLGDERRR